MSPWFAQIALRRTPKAPKSLPSPFEPVLKDISAVCLIKFSSTLPALISKFLPSLGMTSALSNGKCVGPPPCLARRLVRSIEFMSFASSSRGRRGKLCSRLRDLPTCPLSCWPSERGHRRARRAAGFRLCTLARVAGVAGVDRSASRHPLQGLARSAGLC